MRYTTELHIEKKGGGKQKNYKKGIQMLHSTEISNNAPQSKTKNIYT